MMLPDMLRERVCCLALNSVPGLYADDPAQDIVADGGKKKKEKKKRPLCWQSSGAANAGGAVITALVKKKQRKAATKSITPKEKQSLEDEICFLNETFPPGEAKDSFVKELSFGWLRDGSAISEILDTTLTRVVPAFQGLRGPFHQKFDEFKESIITELSSNHNIATIENATSIFAQCVREALRVVHKADGTLSFRQRIKRL